MPRGAGSHGVARGGGRDAGAAALITRGVSSPLRMLRLGRRTRQGSDRTAERSRGQLPVQLGNAAARLALTGQPAARSPKSTSTKCSTAMQRTRPCPAGREGGGEGRRARSPLTAHGQSPTPHLCAGQGPGWSPKVSLPLWSSLLSPDVWQNKHMPASVRGASTQESVLILAKGPRVSIKCSPKGEIILGTPTIPDCQKSL